MDGVGGTRADLEKGYAAVWARRAVVEKKRESMGVCPTRRKLFEGDTSTRANKRIY